MRVKIFSLLLILITISSCGSTSSNSGKRHLHDAIGAAYEVFIVTPKSVWEGPVGDTIRFAMTRDVEMLNQSEPRLSLKIIEPHFFKTLNARHRNVVKVEIADTLQAGVRVDQEVHSKEQVIVTFTAPNDSVMISLIDNNRDEIVSMLEDMEIKRYNKIVKETRDNVISDSVSTIFGMTMDIPRGYKIRNVQENDFMWISYETASVSQGIVIYQYPRVEGDLTSAEILTVKRNEYVSRIPGALDSSYMRTSPHIMPDMEQFYINGQPWVELKGLWSVENDFMGGPFISYTTINPATNMVLTLDFYVYSPKPNKPKRNLLRQLESMVYSVKFPQEPKTK